MAKVHQTQGMPISEIHFYQDLYPRYGAWYVQVYRLMGAIRAGKVLDPIAVTRLDGEVILVDGYHRLQAYQKLKRDMVEVEVVSCESRDDILVESIKRNITHGLQLSPHDMRRDAAILHKKGMSWDEIGRLLGWPAAELKKDVEEKNVGWERRPGFDYIDPKFKEPTIMKTVLENSPTPPTTESAQSRISGKSQEDLLRQVIDIVRNGWLAVDDEKVIELVYELRALLLPFKRMGRRPAQ